MNNFLDVWIEMPFGMLGAIAHYWIVSELLGSLGFLLFFTFVHRTDLMSFCKDQES